MLWFPASGGLPLSAAGIANAAGLPAAFACSSEGWGEWALGGLEAALLVAVLAEEADEVGAEGEDALVLGGEIGGVF